MESEVLQKNLTRYCSPYICSSVQNVIIVCFIELAGFYCIPHTRLKEQGKNTRHFFFYQMLEHIFKLFFSAVSQVWKQRRGRNHIWYIEADSGRYEWTGEKTRSLLPSSVRHPNFSRDYSTIRHSRDENELFINDGMIKQYFTDDRYEM